MLPKSAVSAHSYSLLGEAWGVRLIHITLSKCSSNWISRFGGTSLVLNFFHQERSKNEAMWAHHQSRSLPIYNTKLTPLDLCSAKAVVTRLLDTQQETCWIKLPLNSSSLCGGRKLPIFVHASKSFLLFQQHFVGRVEGSQENLTRLRNTENLLVHTWSKSSQAMFPVCSTTEILHAPDHFFRNVHPRHGCCSGPGVASHGQILAGVSLHVDCLCVGSLWVKSQGTDSTEFLSAGIRSDLGSQCATFGEGASAHAFPLPQFHSIGSLEHFRFSEVSAHSFRHLLLRLKPAWWTMSLQGRFVSTKHIMGGHSFLSQNDHTISAAFQIPVSSEEKLSSNLLKSSVLSSKNEAVRALKWATRLPFYGRNSRQWKVSGIECSLWARISDDHESIGQTAYTCMHMCLRAHTIVVSILVFVISQYSH